MDKIIYVGFYDVADSIKKRNVPLAGANKMSYIISTLESIAKKVKVLSASQVLDKRICRNEKIKLSENSVLNLPFCFGKGGIAKRILNKITIQFQILYNLIFKTNKSTSVIVYHSLYYMSIVKLAKRIKNFDLILEIEEIYGDVLGNSKVVKKELSYFKIADKYIFPTRLLNDKINIDNKPYVLVHGTYQVERDRGVCFDDDKIHIVYAGTFDPRKGGISAVASAEWLDEKYHLHIIGFGSEAETQNIKNMVEETNNKSRATVTYDGQLTGEGYIEFLQKCHIGLSPQNPDADFNATSFPSKILSYMANGLRVVSIRIPAIENSEVSGEICFYNEQTPQQIAQAIRKIELFGERDKRSYEKIKELDAAFKRDISEVIQKGF